MANIKMVYAGLSVWLYLQDKITTYLKYMFVMSEPHHDALVDIAANVCPVKTFRRISNWHQLKFHNYSRKCVIQI